VWSPWTWLGSRLHEKAIGLRGNLWFLMIFNAFYHVPAIFWGFNHKFAPASSSRIHSIHWNPFWRMQLCGINWKSMEIHGNFASFNPVLGWFGTSPPSYHQKLSDIIHSKHLIILTEPTEPPSQICVPALRGPMDICFLWK
jgi:hypothetical protein